MKLPADLPELKVGDVIVYEVAPECYKVLQVTGILNGKPIFTDKTTDKPETVQ